MFDELPKQGIEKLFTKKRRGIEWHRRGKVAIWKSEDRNKVVTDRRQQELAKRLLRMVLAIDREMILSLVSGCLLPFLGNHMH